MSASAVVAGDLLPSEGGFFSFDGGNFLAPMANDFINGESVNFASFDPQLLAGTILGASQIDLGIPWMPVWPALAEEGAAGNREGEVDDRPSDLFKFDFTEKKITAAAVDLFRGTESLISTTTEETRSTTVIGQRIGSTDDHTAGTGQARGFDIQADVLPANHDDRSKAGQHQVLPEVNTPPSNPPVATANEPSAVPGWMGLPAMDSIRQRLLSGAYDTAAPGQSAVIAEGGIIEVDKAIVDTQHAYESHLFSAVASLLDEQDFLAQPAPPVRQPPASELARAVVFELASLEPISAAVPPDDAFESGHQDPAEPALDVPLSDRGEEAELDLSRALAFAQWPLMFSATAGAMLMAQRRRTRPSSLPAAIDKPLSGQGCDIS